MARREAPRWNTIRVRESTYREIERALNCDEVKREGISNITQFATSAITKYLRELEWTRMSLISTYKDHTKIMDNKLGRIGRIVTVYFRKGEDAWCEFCDETDCIHIQYAWELPEVRKILRVRGLNLPQSRVPGRGAGRSQAPPKRPGTCPLGSRTTTA